MRKDICALLGIRYPIFQGAMTFVSDQHLVSAVSNAGGLGIFAPGDDSARGGADWLREQIRAIKALTSQPFGVNLPMRSPLIADFVTVLCEERVKVATTGGGNPAPYLPQLKEAGVIVAPVVPDAKVAQKMEETGADLVIASGMEAGGFVGSVSTLVTLPQEIQDRVALAPHLGGITEASFRRAHAHMWRNAERLAAGERPDCVVNGL